MTKHNDHPIVTPEEWTQRGRKMALALFKRASREIPAYKDFLKKNNFDASKVKTWTDFQSVPHTSKKDYLRHYPFESLCWKGTLRDTSFVLAASSGSTGDPFYFPRAHLVDEFATSYHEEFLDNATRKGSTLVMVCFGMGVWVGGMITYQSFRNLSERGHNLSIITPGVNKKEIFEALKHVAPLYDNLIICSYPPFLKDIVDEAPSHGINWADLHVRIICAAEAFSEQFRDYIVRKVFIEDPIKDIMNIYGTADIGLMAQETPLSIAIRRSMTPSSKVFKELLAHSNRLPTFAQFYPDRIQFESVNKSILITGDNTMPLIRYEIIDNGGVVDFTTVKEILARHTIDLDELAKKYKIRKPLGQQPFVYVYERVDLSTKLYGAIIYPEHIKDGIAHPSLEEFVTGKFTMSTKHDRQQNEYLEINVELKPNVEISTAIEETIAERVSESLLEKNAEHRNNFGIMQNRLRPRIKLLRHEHPDYFKPGIKQKWVKK